MEQQKQQDEERQWLADQLGTPWATKFDLGGIKILNSRGMVVAKMVMENDNRAALAAAEICDYMNRRY